jgi:GTP-binding protein
VFNKPGVTRDIRDKEISILGKKATVVDTPGMFDYSENENKSEFLDAITRKLIDVVKSANLVIFVIDGVTSVTTNDFEIARILRKNGKQVIIAINKSENKTTQLAYSDTIELGFEDIIQISAEHGIGIDELLETVDKYLPDKDDLSEITNPTLKETIKLAIVGRPNVGKSAMVNCILGENRRLVGNFAGLTRESFNSDFEINGRRLTIIDTPGLRRKAKISDLLERLSATNSWNSYKNADVVILMIDASSLASGKIEKQDLTLAANIIKEGKVLVIAFNKYDLTPYKLNEIPIFLKHNFTRSFSQLKEVPFLFVSALKNENVEKMLKMALSFYDKQKQKIKTSDLNNWLREINQNNLIQSLSTKFKMKYITQVKTAPPTFLIFTTNKESIREDYKRYITNHLKRCFQLTNIPVKVAFKDA